jgi:hypothetical protein
MFTNLKNALQAEAQEAKEKTRFYIETGYWPTWAEQHRHQSDDGLRKYSTARRWDQYRAGEIDREKAVALAVARMEKQEEKHLAEKLGKLDRVAAAPDLDSVSISVEWKRSSVWGYNPTATVTIQAGGTWKQYTGTASGCGYDKRTAAIGEALNKSESVKKMLYTIKEKALDNPPAVGRCAGPGYFEKPTTNNSLIHYGAGYGVLPYFEGGVGISSFYGVFEACGYVCTASHETKTTDFYVFSRKGDK